MTPKIGTDFQKGSCTDSKCYSVVLRVRLDTRRCSAPVALLAVSEDQPSLPIIPLTNQFMPRMSASANTAPAATLTLPSWSVSSPA